MLSGFFVDWFFSVMSATFLFLETLEALLMAETLLLTEVLSLTEALSLTGSGLTEGLPLLGTCSGEATAWLSEMSLLEEMGEKGERETADLGEESGRFKLI